MGDPGADSREHDLRRQMVEVGAWMWQRGHIAGTDGNLSARLASGRILATPSGVCKGRLEPSDLVVTDLDGRLLDGQRQPSSELRVHLAAYRLRSDVGAVVHAHPKAAVAHSLAGVSLAPAILPETVFSLGIIAAAAYDTPGSAELAARLEASLRDHDAIIMERHGTVTLGRDLAQAYDRLEALEHAAQILLMARNLGSVEPLPSGEVARLLEIARRAPPTAAADRAALDPELVERLVRQVLDRLDRR